MSTFLPSPKSLDDIMKLDSLQDKQPEEIEALWMEVGSPAVSLPPAGGSASLTCEVCWVRLHFDHACCSTTATTRGIGLGP